MQTGRSRVGYPVEEGNSEVSALTGYPAMTGKSKVRSPCGRVTRLRVGLGGFHSARA